MIIFWERKKSPTPFQCHFNLQLNSLSLSLPLSFPSSFSPDLWVEISPFLTSHCRKNFLLKIHPILNYLSQTSVFERCFPLPILGWYFADDCRPLETLQSKGREREIEIERTKKKGERDNEFEWPNRCLEKVQLVLLFLAYYFFGNRKK